MAIFKRKRTKNGKVIQDSSYTIQFTDHNCMTRRLPGFESKRPTETLLSRIETLVSFRTAGQQPDIEHQKFIDTLPNNIIEKLVKWGIITGSRINASILVDEHLKDFKQSLEDKGCSIKHITTIIPRVRNTLKTCKAACTQDISTKVIQRHISGLKVSEQTRKHYVRNLKQFSKWLYDTGRVSTDLLARLEIPKVNETVRVRRALTIDEAGRLLQSAKNNRIFYQGISGYERYLIYSLALTTGLRANEIRTLTVNDFDFASHTVTVKPRNEKNRKGVTLPLRQELSAEIMAFTADKMPTAKALIVPSRTADMIQIDLIPAKINYQTDQGFADFHALRHTFGTSLSQNGVSPQIAQRLMRHSDPKLTQNLYTHLLVSDLRTGADKLPDYKLTAEEKQKATGTSDIAPKIRDTPRDTKSAHKGEFQRTSADDKPVLDSDSLKLKNPVFDTKNSVLDTKNRAFEAVRLKGFEPQTFGSVDRCSIQLSYRRIKKAYSF